MSKISNAKPRPSKLESVEKKDFLKLVMNGVQIFAFLCKYADKIPSAWKYILSLFDN